MQFHYFNRQLTNGLSRIGKNGRPLMGKAEDEMQPDVDVVCMQQTDGTLSALEVVSAAHLRQHIVINGLCAEFHEYERLFRQCLQGFCPLLCEAVGSCGYYQPTDLDISKSLFIVWKQVIHRAIRIATIL